MAAIDRTEIQIYRRSPELSLTVKECRLALHMSSSEFAKKIHRDRQFLRKLENAELAFDSQTLEDCAEALGLTTAELVDIANSKQIIVLQPEA